MSLLFKKLPINKQHLAMVITVALLSLCAYIFNSSISNYLVYHRDFVAQGIATLSKFDEELAAFFESIMSQNLMLNVSGSRLSECPVSMALQVVYFHASTVPNFYEEKRYG
jgi:hypothetical protein